MWRRKEVQQCGGGQTSSHQMLYFGLNRKDTWNNWNSKDGAQNSLWGCDLSKGPGINTSTVLCIGFIIIRTVEKIIKEVIAEFNLLSLRFLLRIKFLSPVLCRRRRWLADKMVTGLLAALRGRSCQSQLPAIVGMATPSPGLPVFLQTVWNLLFHWHRSTTAS